MPQTTRYCPHCQQQFSFAAAQAHCPECGETLIRWHDSPTVELSAGSSERLLQRAQTRDEIEQLEGTQLAHYQIERFLGQGGMAHVYLATHTTLHRPCALKLLHNVDVNPQVIELFLAEARTVASLVHPHVVTLHNIGEAGGRHFIEMEYVQGNSLGHHLDSCGTLSPLEATQTMVDVCAALAAAHEIDLVHRDIKPSNVLLTRRGAAKLADFGLAKQINSSRARARGVLCGTPNYMAPELFHGEPATKQSDIYSMGVTYFALLTGELPFSTESLSELAAIHATRRCVNFDLHDKQIPRAVADVLRRALSHDVSQRYGSAADMLTALRALFGNLRPLSSLVEEALQDVKHEIRGSGDQYSIRLALENGRGQTVNVEVTDEAETGEQIVRIYSVCGQASEDHFERALLLNASISHGSLAIQEIEGVPYFVMTNAYPRATCDAIEVRRSVLDIARHADDLERLITGRDVY